jgi:xylan 1,4-beta-xylosidase
VKLQEYRIDKDHSNSYEVWKAMGSPQHPTKEQITQLEKVGQLQQTANKTSKPTNGSLQMNVSLPRQGIVFYKIHW